MLKKFISTFQIKLPKNEEENFARQLDVENAERIFMISILGVVFFVLLLFLDIQRIQNGQFDTSYFYKVSMFLHMSLGLFILPAFLIQSNAKKIVQTNYPPIRAIIYGSVFAMAAILVPMALFATIDRKSLMTFVIYMILLNLFLRLPKKVLYLLNFLSIVALIIGVLLIEQENSAVLIAALIEAIGISIPIFILALYQNANRVRQYLHEEQIKEQSQLLQKSLEKDYNQRLIQIEMRALRAQMNPHFIFNVLNSIKLFMVQNDAQTAANYLTKFSKLIRLILNNSKSQMIMMSEELEALKLYIDIENFRFNDKFDYEISVQGAIDPEFVELPPLILQPYVENAIWHGLMHKEGERGLLKIEAKMTEEDALVFIIEDNGIGRAQAKLIRSNSARKKKYKSIGMDLTRDRIEMTNQFYKTNATIEVIDLKNEDGKAAGTRVVLKLPIT